MPEDKKEDCTKIWSLEEIDALLCDSVSPAAPAKDSGEAQNEKTRRISKTRDDFFDPRPARNENIRHNIKTAKVEHSPTGDMPAPPSDALENDKYRQRFMNRPVRILEKTQEHNATFGVNPEKPIEKEGVIKRESNFKYTQDLAPLPTLVSPEEVLAQDALERKIKSGGVLDANETEKTPEGGATADTLGQIRIDGFDDAEEPVRKVDESEVERELYERRREKAREFSVNAQVLPEREKGSDVLQGHIYSESPKKKKSKKEIYTYENDEYRFSDDKIRFTYSLKKRYKNALLSLVIQAASLLLICVLCVIPVLGEGISFAFFGGSEKIFLISCAAAAAAGIGAGFGTLKKGVLSLVRLKPNCASCALFTVIVSVIQLIVFMSAEGTVFAAAEPYLAVGVAALLFFGAGELMRYRRALLNFHFITDTQPLFAVESICKEDEAFEIGRGLLLGEPDIKASMRTLFPSGFMELSSKRFVSDELAGRLFPITLALAAAAGVIAGVIYKDYMAGFGTFAAASCIGLPVCAYLADNVVLSAVSKKLLSGGAMISGYEAMDNCLGANAVALESSQIFDASKCNIFGIKTFHSMRVDEAILYTAAMIIEAKAPLSGVFDSVILGRRELLPPVETLAYEDKLGLSAWIHNRRVLVGGRELLINHNVETPTKDFEKKYLHDGRYPLYLAIEGKIAAMFIVSYEGNTSLSPLIRCAEKNGVTLLVKTSDANITEDMICSALRLAPGSTKVLSAIAGEIFDECRSGIKPNAQAHVLHDGAAYSMLKALCAVFSLSSFKSVTAIMQTVGCAIGVAFTAVLSFTAGLTQISPIRIIVYQLFWAALTAVLIKFRNKR